MDLNKRMKLERDQNHIYEKCIEIHDDFVPTYFKDMACKDLMIGFTAASCYRKAASTVAKIDCLIDFHTRIKMQK